MSKRAFHIVGPHSDILHSLVSSLLYVAFERHRGDARIVAVREQLHCAISAVRSDGDVGNIAGHAGDLAELFRAHFKEEFICDFKAEPGLLRKLKDGKRTGKIKDFKRQVLKNCRPNIHPHESLRSLNRTREWISFKELKHRLHAGHCTITTPVANIFLVCRGVSDRWIASNHLSHFLQGLKVPERK